MLKDEYSTINENSGDESKKSEFQSDLSQLRLMLWKNYILKKRRSISSCMEILIPVFMMTIILIGYYSSASPTYQQESYLDLLTKTEDFDSYVTNLINNPDVAFKIAFAPEDENANSFALVQDVYNRINANYPVSFPKLLPTLYQSEKSLLDYALHTDTITDELWVAVIFSQTGENGQWAYTLRTNTSDVGYNYSSIPDTSSWYEELEKVPRDFQTTADMKSTNYDFDPYLESGLVTLQQVIDAAIIEREAENMGNFVSVNMDVYYAPFPTPKYKRTEFFDALGSTIGLFVSLGFLWPVSRLVKNLVEEKETKIKEGMKMMGLKNWVFSASWFITYFFIFTVTGILITLVLGPSLFSHCDQFLILISFLIFSYSIVGFCFLTSMFFDKAKMAATIVPLIFLATTMPEYGFNSDSSNAARFFTGVLLSPTAFSFGLQALIDYEIAEKGVNWVNLYDGSGFTFGMALWSLILSNFLYFFLAWYFEKVLPHEYGTHLPPYFLFTRDYWQAKETKDEKQPLLSTGLRNVNSPEGSGQSVTAYVEPVGSDLIGKEAVQISGLRKVYETNDGDKLAVENLCLNFYNGQISALLGHNGAGKSTTIAMLTGLYPPTSGDCYINGLSVVRDMGSIRRSLGVCPQHDILFDVLTVKEHLELFAGLKGVPKHLIASEVTQKIKEVGLEDKTNTFSSSLSGGMKRKLSVAIALIGDSKVVFLDEPTSGMDPYARRATWELLQKSKHNRVIVLTTHFMDEADLLGDRIAIMAKGKLRCVGSSLFLKSRYGVGYHLTVVKDESKFDGDRFEGLVKSYVKDANLLTNVGAEVSYQLPLHSVQNFPSLFQQLESSQGSDNGVVTFGISVTTLEEVFMRIGEETELDVDQIAEDKRKSLEVHKRITSQEITNKNNSFVHKESMDNDDGNSRHDFARSKEVMTFSRHLLAMLYKRSKVGKRDKKAICCQIILPVVVVMVFLAILAGSTIPDAKSMTCDLDKTGNHYYIPYTDTPFASEFVENNSPFTSDFRVLPSVTTNEGLNDYLVSTISEDYEFIRPAAVNFEEAPITNETEVIYTFTVLHNQSYYHMIPTMQSIMSTIILNNITGGYDVNNLFQITTTIHPFPLTDRQRELIDSIIAVIIAIFILIPFCFVPANFAVYIVKERENKAKHVQMVAGVNKYAYWLGHYIWDFLSYMVGIAFTIIVFAAFDRKEFIGTSDRFFATLLLFVMYGLASIPWTYAWSFLFYNHSSAQNVLLMVNFVCGFVTVEANFILDLFDSTRPINDVLVYFYRLLPPFCLGEGITSLSLLDLVNSFGDGEKSKPFDFDVTGRDFVYMLGQTIAFSILVIILEDNETFINKILFGRQKEPNDVRVLPNEDEDVSKERKRVADGKAEDDVIVLKNLRKVYPSQNNNAPKVAVHDLSIGIPAGECFGFLGVNGAGKTTTLSMLSGDFLPTSGNAILNGSSILNDIHTIRNELGYCPQFDALVELMTGEEVLTMFAMIKGIQQVDQAVETSLTQMDLQQYRKKACGTYSGGNKRKLSVAIALMANPKIVFLDEPSTGMDPVARRFMWDIISNNLAGRSIILTTHSMEECEALCTRIGIMVGGRLKCLGSAQHLKARFGQGYQIELNGDVDNINNIMQFVQSTFPGAKLLESHGGQIRYDIPQQNLKLSSVFATIESQKKQLGIKEYGISQTTLEQVFITKAKYQENEHDRNSQIIQSV